MRRLKKAFNLITAEPLVEAKAPVLGSDGRRTVPVRSYLDTSPRGQRLSELDKVRLVPDSARNFAFSDYRFPNSPPEEPAVHLIGTL
jgi:hypothetical protein